MDGDDDGYFISLFLWDFVFRNDRIDLIFPN